MSIIDGLRLSLDHSVDSSLSENLEGLYDYMNRRLLLANVKNDTEALDEVSGLLRELKRPGMRFLIPAAKAQRTQRARRSYKWQCRQTLTPFALRSC